MIKRFRVFGLWRLAYPVMGDALICFLSLGAALVLRDSHLLNASMCVAFAPLFLLWLATFYALGLYELHQIRDFLSLVRNSLVSMSACWVLGAVYFYLISPYTDLRPKTILLLVVIISHVFLIGWRRLLLYILDYHLLNQRIAFLGDEGQVRIFEETMREHSRPLGFRSVRWGLDGADILVVDIRWAEDNWEKARDMLSMAIHGGVPVINLESFYEMVFGKVSPEYAGNPAWPLEFVLPRSQGIYPKIKRALDLLMASVLLLLLSPLMASVCLLILLMERSSPFYGQRRIGFLGEEFILLKFRTMVDNADQAGPFTSYREKDGRITRLGQWLRRFRLDELPQLWNVLRGEMSLVGPRPEWIREVEILEKAVPHYHLRHLVRPGITGWAQVYYRATNDPQDSIEKHHFDLYYLKYFSFALDCAILLKTFKRVFIKDSRVFASGAPQAKFHVSTRRLPPNAGSIITRKRKREL